MVTYYLIASDNIWSQPRLIQSRENKTHSHFTVVSTTDIVFPAFSQYMTASGACWKLDRDTREFCGDKKKKLRSLFFKTVESVPHLECMILFLIDVVKLKTQIKKN